MSEYTYESSAETAKKIRKALKDEFNYLPARHFSVKSSTYSGGSSVTVSWDNFPTDKEVRKITDKFASSSFDGMEDMKTTSGYMYEGKRYNGADFVHTSRNVTQDRNKKALEYAKRIYGTVNMNDYEDVRKVQDVERLLDSTNVYTGDRELRYELEEEEVGVESTETNNKINNVNIMLQRKRSKFMLRVWTRLIETAKDVEDLRKKSTGDKELRYVDNVVEMTKNQFEEFEKDLQKENNFLKGIEKVASLIVCKEKDYALYVNPKGNLQAKITGEVTGFDYERDLQVKDSEVMVGENKVEVNKEDDKVSELNNQEMINKIYEESHEWMVVNGFSVDKKKVDEDISKESLLAIEDLSGGSSEEELRIRYEKYFFMLLNKRVEGVKITKEDRNVLNSELKKLVIQKANEGKIVDLKKLKNDVNTVQIVKMKKVKYRGGNFVEEIQDYLDRLCEENLVKSEVTEETTENTAENRVAEEVTATTETKDVKGESITSDKLRNLIDVMKDSIVTLVFEKADGTLRTMVATREDKYIKTELNINTKEEIAKQVDSGTIPVWDVQKGAVRAFRAERLKSYTVNGKTFDVDQEQNQADVSVHFDPSTLRTDQMLKVLSKSVVRVSFIKGDGSIRVLWGTRHRETIELYQPVGNPMLKNKGEDLNVFDSEEKRRAQIDGDYVRVFDLAINEFRTFKPSTLLRMDELNNVASWIEFKPRQDGWYNCLNSGDEVSKYYKVGDRKAIESAERENKDRVQQERELQREIDEVNYTRTSIQNQRTKHEEEKELVLQESNDRKQRWKTSNAVIKPALESIESYTEQDEETLKKMYTYINNLQDKFIELQSQGKGRGEIKNISINEKLRVVMFGYEEDVFILHPRFVLNGISHKVYADRTELIKFENNARVSEADRELAKELDTLSTLVTGRRVRNVLDVKLVEEDIRRIKRLRALDTKFGTKLAECGIKMVYVKSGDQGQPPHFMLQVNGKRFIVSPAILYSVDRKEALYRRERYTSTLAEFSEAIKSNEQLEISAEAYKILYGILIHAFDLRKKVLNEDGERV